MRDEDVSIREEDVKIGLFLFSFRLKVFGWSPDIVNWAQNIIFLTSHIHDKFIGHKITYIVSDDWVELGTGSNCVFRPEFICLFNINHEEMLVNPKTHVHKDRANSDKIYANLFCNLSPSPILSSKATIVDRTIAENVASVIFPLEVSDTVIRNFQHTEKYRSDWIENADIIKYPLIKEDGMLPNPAHILRDYAPPTLMTDIITSLMHVLLADDTSPAYLSDMLRGFPPYAVSASMFLLDPIIRICLPKSYQQQARYTPLNLPKQLKLFTQKKYRVPFIDNTLFVSPSIEMQYDDRNRVIVFISAESDRPNEDIYLHMRCVLALAHLIAYEQVTNFTGVCILLNDNDSREEIVAKMWQITPGTVNPMIVSAYLELFAELNRTGTCNYCDSSLFIRSNTTEFFSIIDMMELNTCAILTINVHQYYVNITALFSDCTSIIEKTMSCSSNVIHDDNGDTVGYLIN